MVTPKKKNLIFPGVNEEVPGVPINPSDSKYVNAEQLKARGKGVASPMEAATIAAKNPYPEAALPALQTQLNAEANLRKSAIEENVKNTADSAGGEARVQQFLNQVNQTPQETQVVNQQQNRIPLISELKDYTTFLRAATGDIGAINDLGNATPEQFGRAKTGVYAAGALTAGAALPEIIGAVFPHVAAIQTSAAASETAAIATADVASATAVSSLTSWAYSVPVKVGLGAAAGFIGTYFLKPAVEQTGKVMTGKEAIEQTYKANDNIRASLRPILTTVKVGNLNSPGSTPQEAWAKLNQQQKNLDKIFQKIQEVRINKYEAFINPEELNNLEEYSKNTQERITAAKSVIINMIQNPNKNQMENINNIFSARQ